MSYTKRTCSKCGYIDIQPNMILKTIDVDVGSSEAALSKRAIFGSLTDNKKSSKQIQNWASGKSKRNYKRKRNVWMCRECGEPWWYRTGGVLYTIDAWLWRLFKIVAPIAGLMLFVKIMEIWSKT